MGGVIMVGGCRLHSHSRGGATQALSSAEGEIMSASELLKEALGVQFILEFIGFGTLAIHLLTDASAAKAFMHRRGAGRMKHIDIRYMWLQDACDKGAYQPKKLPRAENPSDMLTKVPATIEVQKYRVMVGLFPLDLALEPEKRVCEAILGQSSHKKIMSAIMLASMVGTAKGDVGWHEVSGYSNIVVVMLVQTLAFLVMVIVFLSTRTKIQSADHRSQGTQTVTISMLNEGVQTTATFTTPTTSVPTAHEVVVSRYGHRYHRASCSTIVDSVGLRHLTRCQVCCPYTS